MSKICPLLVVFQICIFLSDVINVHSFATPNSDFLLTIDENSAAVSHLHTCVLEQKLGVDFGGRPHCWGFEDFGQTNAPSDVTFVQLVAGMFFTCGITLDQTVQCWGQMHSPTGMFMQLTAGIESYYACGVTNDGRISCWGNHVPNGVPMNEMPDVKYVQISCANTHCCAIDANAYPHCWGSAHLESSTVPTLTHTEYLESVKTNGRNLYVKHTHSQNVEEEEDEEVALLKMKRGGAKQGGVSLEDSSSSSSSGEGEEGDDFVETISKIQFRQISVSDGLTCGIMLIGQHLRCWGKDRDRVIAYPSFVMGPFRQVSVGNAGLCVIADVTPEGQKVAETTFPVPEHHNKFVNGKRVLHDKTVINREPDSLTCWGTVNSFINPTYFAQWDSITLGDNSACGVSMDSELGCFAFIIGDEHKKYIVA